MMLRMVAISLCYWGRLNRFGTNGSRDSGCVSQNSDGRDIGGVPNGSGSGGSSSDGDGSYVKASNSNGTRRTARRSVSNRTRLGRGGLAGAA